MKGTGPPRMDATAVLPLALFRAYLRSKVIPNEMPTQRELLGIPLFTGSRTCKDRGLPNKECMKYCFPRR